MVKRLSLGLVACLAILFTSALFAAVSSAFPHGGGLDSLGCHHDRQRGETRRFTPSMETG